MVSTSIEWTEATWNPIVGCSVVSPGCTNCYAMKMAARIDRMQPSGHYAGMVQASKAGAVWTGKVALAPDRVIMAPLRRRKPTTYFVNSMGDLFHENVPDEWIDRAFAIMALTPQHTYQILTKRADRMQAYLANDDSIRRMIVSIEGLRVDKSAVGPLPHLSPGARWFPLANVWLGVSVEDQTRADERIPHLLATPAAIRFVSAEPLLGPVQFSHMDVENTAPTGFYVINALTGRNSDMGRPCPDVPRLDWVICGGESGPGARPMHPDWARSLRDQCAAAGVPYFFKQWGAWLPWESASAPMWESQAGEEQDKHTLFPTDFDPDPHWDDGIGFLKNGEGHAAFQRVGKKRSGRLLDGRIHDGMPDGAGATS